ncbi:unnamed protein product [Amoebophrya sp. A120]|nr:unnamed protein product [Amoebophrya sp. A120]|eukprot:GSA120T00014853001.1
MQCLQSQLLPFAQKMNESAFFERRHIHMRKTQKNYIWEKHKKITYEKNAKKYNAYSESATIVVRRNCFKIVRSINSFEVQREEQLRARSKTQAPAFRKAFI